MNLIWLRYYFLIGTFVFLIIMSISFYFYKTFDLKYIIRIDKTLSDKTKESLESIPEWFMLLLLYLIVIFIYPIIIYIAINKKT